MLIGGVCTLRGVSSSCASREIGKSVVSEKPVEIGVKRKINEDEGNVFTYRGEKSLILLIVYLWH